MEIVGLKQIFGNEITNNRMQKKENKNIMNIFLNNLDKPIEYKTHPIATMIKGSFKNLNDGDLVGFKKSSFMKCCQDAQTIFQISNKTEKYWNWNLFLRKSKRESKHIENTKVEIIQKRELPNVPVIPALLNKLPDAINDIFCFQTKNVLVIKVGCQK